MKMSFKNISHMEENTYKIPYTLDSISNYHFVYNDILGKRCIYKSEHKLTRILKGIGTITLNLGSWNYVIPCNGNRYHIFRNCSRTKIKNDNIVFEYLGGKFIGEDIKSISRYNDFSITIQRKGD